MTEATGSKLEPYGALTLAAWQGNEAELCRLAETSMRDVTQRAEGIRVTVIQWTLAFLYNGLGRYAEALAAAQQPTS